MKILKRKTLAIQKLNNEDFNLKKAIEELTELSLILIKSTTRTVTNEEIIEEIGDVQRVLWWLEDKYGKNHVVKRIKYKNNRIKQKRKNADTR